MSRTQASYRDERRRMGIVSLLDQFLDTPHPLPQREAIARTCGMTTAALELLLISASHPDEKAALEARLTLNLAMAGAGKVRA